MVSYPPLVYPGQNENVPSSYSYPPALGGQPAANPPFDTPQVFSCPSCGHLIPGLAIFDVDQASFGPVEESSGFSMPTDHYYGDSDTMSGSLATALGAPVMPILSLPLVSSQSHVACVISNEFSGIVITAHCSARGVQK
jgi:hypothetical protein